MASALTAIETTYVRPGLSDSLLASLMTYPGYSVDASSDTPIVPGQPIPLSFIFTVYDTRLQVGTIASVKVYRTLKKKSYLLLTILSVPIVDGGAFGWRSTGLVSNPTDSITPNTPAGEAVYAIGEHELTIEVTTDGKDRGPYVGSAWVTVNPEPVDGSWWLWNRGNPSQANWKDAYTLSGTAQNKSGYADLVFEAALHELGPDGAKVIGSVTSAPIAPGKGAPSTFPSITQDWGWLIPSISIYADVSRSFEYTVALHVTDGYGNVYNTNSSPLIIAVQVSQTKLNYAEASITTGWLSIITGIIGAVLWPVLIVSGGAGTASAVTGAKAMDPPLPNRRYNKAVPIPSGSLAWKDTGQLDLESVRVFLSRLVELVRLMNAISETESRLFGAQRDKQGSAILLQRKSAKVLIQRVRTQVRDLPKLASVAGATLEASVDHSLVARASLRARYVSPKTFAKVLKSAGIHRAHTEQVWELWSQPRWRRALLGSGRLSVLCARTTTLLLLAIRQDLSDAIRIIRG